MYTKLTLYMDHVKMNLRDMVPKAITLYIIKKLLSYISHDVLFHSMNLPSDDHVSIASFKPMLFLILNIKKTFNLQPKLLKLDGLDEEKFSAKTKMLAACKEALDKIRKYNILNHLTAFDFEQLIRNFKSIRRYLRADQCNRNR